MEFQISPKWTSEQLSLHRERYYLLVEMNDIYKDNQPRYHILAKRYHEINEILGDDNYNS